ncbi:Hpt domain-containing protein [Pseudodesulfovibrio sp. zrk46]|uniref:Hpt domain-containing protein n=1 Tax=Pseudodesulfovibrio sp. zrk46 TaxID=2725288 RepID=UPI0014492E8A|nr:Hpt domain-containing protein [Pseudodesulfovibrio sp. zrk46]QJB56208.1 Hpt domain-containing protein [Pseudodesulfovibrio sp. zrk46]
MTAIFNETQFLQSLAGDRELALELLGAFMDDSPERVTSLKEALDADDMGKASRLAHSLKGMCGVVRTDILVSLALGMENAAKNGDKAKTVALFTDFKSNLTAAHDEMHKFING